MAAIELALNVLAADGQVDASSLAFVTTCADELGVDADMFAAARDAVLTRTGVSLGTDVDFERLLGIRPDWPSAQIRSHLNREYARWNSRAEALVADDERKHAEQMMEIIASAKKALLT